MELMTMRFGGLTFPVNPTALRVEYSRSVQETALPYQGSRLEDMGPRKRRVTGEGYFTGPTRGEKWQALQALFEQGGPGYLQLPGQGPFLAVMSQLEFIGEPGPQLLRYAFTFVEEQGAAPYTGGRVHAAAAGESLWDYAWRYNCDMDALRRANLHIRDIACLEQGEEVRLP